MIRVSLFYKRVYSQTYIVEKKRESTFFITFRVTGQPREKKLRDEMSCPDPIDEWSQDQIGAWLRGLDAGLDQYKGRWRLNFNF